MNLFGPGVSGTIAAYHTDYFVRTVMRLGPLGIWEILAILVVILLIFGARRLPEIGSSMGKGIRTFKSALMGDDDKQPQDPPPPPPPPAAKGRDESSPY